MTVKFLGDLLLCCALINYAVLIVWFLAFVLAHDWLLRLHSRWFGLAAAQFDALHYGGMAVYKIGTLLLNLVPYCALQLLGHLH
jgi:hypothetical protein